MVEFSFPYPKLQFERGQRQETRILHFSKDEITRAIYLEEIRDKTTFIYPRRRTRATLSATSTRHKLDLTERTKSKVVTWKRCVLRPEKAAKEVEIS